MIGRDETIAQDEVPYTKFQIYRQTPRLALGMYAGVQIWVNLRGELILKKRTAGRAFSITYCEVASDHVTTVTT